MCMSIDAQVTVCEPVADTTDSGDTLKETVQGSIVKLLDDFEKYVAPQAVQHAFDPT